MKPPAKRDCVFQVEFLADLRFWVKEDRRIALRIMDFAEAILRDPFDGPGKPEALRFDLARCWSRRITQEHRLVYRVTSQRIDFLVCRYHY